MSSRNSASYNPTLTNYAQGLAQDTASALAEFLAPTVLVPSTIGQYKRYSDKQAFQIYETSRAIGGKATRIQFSADDPTYNCKPQALEVAVDDAERDAAGSEDSRLDEAKVSTLVTNATISHENKVITAIKAGINASGGVGTWSDADIDPVKEINSLIEAIAIATGIMPNRIAFSLGSWRVFSEHPKVIARQPGAALIGLTYAQAAKMLLNPAIEVRVGVLSKDQAKFGAGKNATNIMGADVFIFYASQNPNVYDPSFAKTFMGGRGGITSVRTYREEPHSDIHLLDWSEDIQIVSAASARRITVN